MQKITTDDGTEVKQNQQELCGQQYILTGLRPFPPSPPLFNPEMLMAGWPVNLVVYVSGPFPGSQPSSHLGMLAW